MSTNDNNKALKIELTINVEFIKLARSLRDAQRAAQTMGHTAGAQRKARNLERLFDAKLETIEKEVAHLLTSMKPDAYPERLL